MIMIMFMLVFMLVFMFMLMLMFVRMIPITRMIATTIITSMIMRTAVGGSSRSIMLVTVSMVGSAFFMSVIMSVGIIVSVFECEYFGF